MESEISVLIVEFQLFVGDDKMMKCQFGSSEAKSARKRPNFCCERAQIEDADTGAHKTHSTP